MGNLRSYEGNTWIQRCFESCKIWLDHVILNELLSTTGIRFKSLEDREIFLKSMYAMVILNFKEWDDPLSQDNAIETLCSRVLRLGFGYDYIIAFGSAFFSGLRTVSGNNFSTEIEKSWKNVYSSVLAICIPYLLRSGGYNSPSSSPCLPTRFEPYETQCDQKNFCSQVTSKVHTHCSAKYPDSTPSAIRLHATPYNFVDLDHTTDEDFIFS
jgi:hypothetical protein